MTSLISKLKEPGELLNHILDQPELPAIIQSLDAGILTRLIRHVGPEESQTMDPLTTLLEEHHLVKLFQVGWKFLFDDVVLYT